MTSEQIVAAIVGAVSAVTGGGLWSVLTKKEENKATKERRQSDEFTTFRAELRAELREAKTEAHRREAEFEARCGGLQERIAKGEDERLQLQEEYRELRFTFAMHRQRVKIFAQYVLSNNPAARDFAKELIREVHEVDGLLHTFRNGAGSGTNTGDAKAQGVQGEEKGVLPTDGEAGAANGLPAPLARLLIVDDEAAICEMLRIAFHVAGYEAATATTGVDGLRLFDEAALAGKPFHLILLDYSMPGLKGGEVARLVRLFHGGATRIVFHTAYANDVIDEDLRDVPILEKPLVPSVLIARVKEMLELKPESPTDTP